MLDREMDLPQTVDYAELGAALDDIRDRFPNVVFAVYTRDDLNGRSFDEDDEPLALTDEQWDDAASDLEERIDRCIGYAELLSQVVEDVTKR